MRDDQMFAIVSDDDTYEFEFGYDSAMEKAEELDEEYDEEFTVYLVGEPVSEVPEPDPIEL